MFRIYGKISIISSNKLDIIGIDMAIMIILLPISILAAIAFSPASAHILTANSVIIARNYENKKYTVILCL